MAEYTNVCIDPYHSTEPEIKKRTRSEKSFVQYFHLEGNPVGFQPQDLEDNIKAFFKKLNDVLFMAELPDRTLERSYRIKECLRVVVRDSRQELEEVFHVLNETVGRIKLDRVMRYQRNREGRVVGAFIEKPDQDEEV